MSQKKINFISLLSFLGLMIILMVIASFYDLQISQFITIGGLEANKYYTSNFMGGFIEIFGSTPLFFFLFLGTLIFAHHFYHKDGKIKYLYIFFLILSVVDLVWFYKDCIKYISHIFSFEIKEVYKYLISFVLTIPSLIGGVLIYKKTSVEQNNKNLKFGFVILTTCALYIIVQLIKGPMGRMRYRGMNLLGDFSGFTPWYEVSKAKEFFGEFLISDAFKSFPSGHTFSGAAIFLLNVIPDVYDKYNSKKHRITFFVISFVFTALVAIYRMRVGAHFLSDVTIGGSLAIIGYHIFRHVFILRKE